MRTHNLLLTVVLLAGCPSAATITDDDTGVVIDDTDTDSDTDSDTDTGDVGDLDVDDDNDGFTENEGDCNDAQPAINPMATDLVGDGIDQNCDGIDGFDGDGDGFASPVSGGNDCDDTDHMTFPGAVEVYYDGIRQDCDDWGNNQWSDNDQDGDGHDADFMGGDDCVDTDADIYGGWRPHFEVNGDGKDNNCNGVTDGFTFTMTWEPNTDPVLEIVITDTAKGSMTGINGDFSMIAPDWREEDWAFSQDGTSLVLQLNAVGTEFEDEFTTLTYMVGFDGIMYVWGYSSYLIDQFVAIGFVNSDPATW